MKMKHVLVAIALLILAGCAGPNNQANVPVNGDVAGFWNGLWHGMTLPISFIGSLLDPTINIYEVHNNGGWYNLGFMIGIGGIGVGFDNATDKEKKR